MQILALDAGATTTRAAVLDSTGRCLGYGRAGGGNPVAVGAKISLAMLAEAAERALVARADLETPIDAAAIAMAGTISTDIVDGIRARFAELGVAGSVTVESDLLGTFHAGTIADDGYALIAGTGAVAARVVRGALAEVSGGNGWLLGDEGSGFWIGHRVVRAVVADLDRLGPATALTDLLVADLGLERSAARVSGRPAVLQDVVDALYALRPVELARFAPLAFHASGDATAESILDDAATALADTLDAVRRVGTDGPVVLGGGLLGSGPLSDRLRSGLADVPIVAVADGVVGAAVTGLRRAGIDVDETVFARLTDGIAALRADEPRRTP